MDGPRIKTITIHDFKGFAKTTVPSLELGGKNVLLYGENGSGKTTIFTALAEMLNPHSSREFNNDLTNNLCLKHRLSSSLEEVGKVSIAFQNGKNSIPVPSMEWKINEPRPKGHQYYSLMARSSGFLDYRAILQTHFLDYENSSINLFSLVVETLFRDVEMPAMAPPVTFGQEWQGLQELQSNLKVILDLDPNIVTVNNPDYFSLTEQIGFDPREYSDEDSDSDVEDDFQSERDKYKRFVEYKKEEFKDRCGLLSDKIYQRFSEIAHTANSYLKEFDPWLEIEFSVAQPCLSTSDDVLKQNDWKSKAYLPLKARYRGLSIAHPGTILNEARLTAIALTFYLAALKIQTPTSTVQMAPRLLVLDDVLIGLDMMHRLPVLDLLKTEFEECNWQILLLTFDKTWFEVAKQRLNGWQLFEMFAIPLGDYEQPMLLQCKDHLERAKAFLNEGEVKAAAVHVRTKFEIVLKSACETFKLAVRYRSDNKYEVRDFWDVLKKCEWSQSQLEYKLDSEGLIIDDKKEVKRKLITPDLVASIQHSLSWVMNPLSHSQSINPYRNEINNAIHSVEKLEREVEYACKMRGTPITNDHINLQTLGKFFVNIIENEIIKRTQHKD